MAETNHGERELERLIFFSDAVFAIVMTLLILEIRVPEVPPALAAAQVPGKVLALWPKFFSYVLSFLKRFAAWLTRHRSTGARPSFRSDTQAFMSRRFAWVNIIANCCRFQVRVLGGSLLDFRYINRTRRIERSPRREEQAREGNEAHGRSGLLRSSAGCARCERFAP